MATGMDRPEFGRDIREKEFCMRKGATFINHGSYGMVPRRIKELQSRYLYQTDAHPDDWFQRKIKGLWMAARDAAASVVNSEVDDVVIVQNATTGINTVLKALQLTETEEILVTNNTYAAIWKTAHHISTDGSGGKLHVLDINFPIQSEDEIVQQYRDFLSQHPKVRIAVLDHITSISALVMPIKKIIKVCRDYNVLSMIDGAHAPGQVQIDMKDIDPDFYAGNFHKWLYTPRGCALLYIRKEHQEWACPLVTAGNYSENVGLQFFMQGTRDDTPYICLPEALRFYSDIGGMEVITRYCSHLLDQAASKMVAAWGTAKLPVPREMEPPCMRMVKLPTLTGFIPSLSNSIRLMSDIYTRWNIQTATMYVDGDLYVRLSANVYNTEADYDTLVAAIQKMRDYDSTANQSPVVTTFGHPIREAEFSLRKGSTFLNNAARGSIPKRVREIHLRYINELDDHPDDWMRRKVKDMWIASRESAAIFVNVDPEDLVFVQNATTGFNSVLKTYPFSPDDAFLFTNNSFEALKNTCHYVSTKLKGMKTYILDVTFPIETDDELVEKHRKILTDHPDIKLVVIDHITSRTALMFPVHKMVKLCQDMGVMALVDGANAPGQVSLDIKALDPDFYSGNFHKWAFAPRGCGFLYVKKVHRPLVKPLVTSHFYQQTMTDEFFMQGCRDDTPYITLKHALQFLQDIGGMEKVLAYNTKLLQEAVDLIISSWETHTLPIPKSLEAPCVRMIKLPVLKDYEGNSEDATRLVDDLYTQYDIQTQMFCVQCQLYLRLSAQVYNELDDYRKLVTVINSLRK
ncbi:uncharacterized protein LOC110451100 [Mizuhopecten yessoensis]|uniref:Aminotransferase n=1 Tax=Mizuhopecten yessoensis TaxID=6573 RepID=A0A210QMF8_MIZYE|nr:uncharacterized protein LOC110451100 [Mizuhopecten yessoensis]OWF49913.1 Aminotransferase [Mizuhopecten yessoensis]